MTGVLYSLVTSNLGGERRFSSACASRLQSLGALTKGDRRASTGSNFSQFDFDNKLGNKALKCMCEHIWKNTTALDEEALKHLQASGQQSRERDRQTDRQSREKVKTKSMRTRSVEQARIQKRVMLIANL